MKKVFLFISIFCFLLGLTSCDTEKKDIKDTVVFEVLPDEFSAPASGKNYSVTVRSSQSWTAVSSASWIYFAGKQSATTYIPLGSSTYDSEGNESFVFCVEKNTSSAPRSGSICVSQQNGSSAYINIQQEGNQGGSGGGDNNEQVPDAPSNVDAYTSGSSIIVSWSSVRGANMYNVYRSSSSSGTYSYLGYSYSTSYTDNSPLNGTNYYKVSAENNSGESSKSSYAYCSYSGSGTGGGSTTKPSAPTGVTASNEGPTMYPYVIIRWDQVADATSYIIYRSTSASGSYSQIGTSDYNSFADDNPKNGTNYYKVAAKNSAGTSAQSSYASVTIDKNAVEPCPPSSISGFVSGDYITMRWSISTASGCGKPTKITVRVYEPYNNAGWFDKEVLSGTATSYKFAWPAYKDSDGFVRMGVILENDYGTDSAVLIYNSKDKKWYGNY